MDANQTIASIRQALNDVQQNGQDFVSTEAMLEFIARLELNASDASEVTKLQHASNLAQHRAIHESNLEMFKSVLEAGRTALTSCILVNGGAAVALLAYIGNLLSKNPDAVAPASIVAGLICFSTAVLFGALATGVRYLSQACFAKRWLKSGNGFNILSILLVLGAYILFACGIVGAYRAFA